MPVRSFLAAHGKLLLLLAVVFIVTTDDRHVGIVADGRQMIWTAVAITETGQLGQARGRDFTYPRKAGDAVSRYGMGMTLAQLPAAFLSPAVERRLGAASSQPLFLVAPLVLTLLAALFAGVAARQISHDRTTEGTAVLLTALGSPLAGYASMEFSEPLQAAALAAAFAFALMAAARPDRAGGRMAFAAGFAVGIAVLTKSSLLVAAPFALLPILFVRKHIVAVVGGASIPMAGWLLFEIVRFGRPFAAYGGERFSHPFADGFWRLLVGANKGMIWFFPTILVSLWVGVMSVRRRNDEGRPIVAVASALLVFLSLLLIAAKWWAWHGAEGWGPRLLVPAIPLLAAVAAPSIASWSVVARRGFIALSIAANLLPLIQHPTPIATLINSSTWPVVDRTTAERVAEYARLRGPAGDRVAPDSVLATIRQASPWVLYPWFIRRTWASATPAGLASPPWLAWRPDIRPELDPLPAVFHVISPRRWRFLGRGLFPQNLQPAYAAVYDEAMIDQIARAQHMGRGEEALWLSRRLDAIVKSADSAVMVMESYRILDMQAAAQSYLGGLPRDRRADPRFNVVIALFERKKGNEASARRFLEDAARSLPGSPAAAAVNMPMARWPESLAEMTESQVNTVAIR